MIKRVFRA